MEVRLLIRPRPFLREGLRGFVLRASEENALSPEIDLYRTLFGTDGPAAATPRLLREAAPLFGIDEQELERVGCRGLTNDATRCGFVGKRVGVLHMRRTQCAVCPHCLSERRAVRAEWELKHVTACADHGCWLFDSCPSCSVSIQWRRPGVARCLCGFDLACSMPVRAPEAVLALTRTIVERLYGDLDSWAGESLGFPSHLRKSSLNDLLSTVYLFSTKRLKQLSRATPDLLYASNRLREQAATVFQAAEALADWPRAWHSVIQRLATEQNLADAESGRLLQSHVEVIAPYAVLQRTAWSPATRFPEFLRRELQVVLRQRAVHVGSRRLFATSNKLRPRPRGAFLPHLFSGRSKDAQVNDLMSPRAVGELLAATSHQLRALQKVGVIARIDTAISTQDVERVFERLNATAVARRRTDQTAYVPLKSFSRVRGDRLERFLGEVLSGRLPCVAWASQRPSGLGNLYVPAKLVEGAVQLDAKQTQCSW